MSRHAVRRGSMVFAAGVLIVALASAPVAALTVITTATPDKIQGKSGTVTYTVTVTDCEDAVLGCFVFGVSDLTTTCSPGVSGCTSAPVTECGPALIGGLAGPDVYECIYTRTYSSDTPGVVTEQLTVDGFVGLAVAPFSISGSETVQIKAKPSTGTGSGSTSVVTGQNVRVRIPSIDVPDTRSATRAARATRVTYASVSKETKAETGRSDADAESIKAEVRSRLR